MQKPLARCACVFVFALVFIATSASILRGQTVTATLTGTIADQTGAIIPGVTVTAINQGTQIEYTAESNSAGVYTIPFLPIGTYVVSAELTGFKKAVTNPIKLEVGQIARVDLKLEVGQISDTVSVSGVAPILQTESTVVGEVISGSTTVNLPLNGRNFAQLTLLVPGAVTPNPGSFTGVSRFGGGGRPYVNGNREQGNSFLLDGVETGETIDNRIGYSPNIDAIAEFKIETNNSSAEFGNVTGAIVNTSLKSGTNEFHGNAFEFLRNDAFDANTWANNRSGADKQTLRQNVFGATFGGPLIRNKLFFFGDYQGIRHRSGGGTTVSVAPAEWRTGNLSSLSTVIRDPLTQQQFPNNMIPASRIVNPVAKALFADPELYPLPNRTILGVQGNYATTFANAVNNDQWDLRVDTKISAKDDLFGRFSYNTNNEPGIRGSLPTNPTRLQDAEARNFVLNWTRTVSPTAVNEARFGFQRTYIVTAINDWAGIGKGNARLGVPGDQPIDGLSQIALGNGLTTLGSAATVERNAPNTFQYGDNFSFSKGRHFMKTGMQWLRYQQNRFYPGNNGLLGVFNYTGIFTGSAFADFLLDQLQNKGRGSQTGTWGHRQNRVGIFFQDDFKLRRNLTLNLGMRWEYTSPVVEVRDRQSNFDLLTGKQLFAGQDGNSRALYDPYHKGFEPRVGFAWSPGRFNSRMVLRAGYGIVQFMEGTGSNLRLPLNPPFFFESDVTFNATTGPGTITKGFTDVVPLNQVSGQVRLWNPDLRPQFTQQWNLSLEYQFSETLSLTAAYVGHDATHLVAPTEFNQPLPDPGPVSGWRPAQQRRRLYPFQPLITNISGTDSSATSSYNALQVSGRKRYAQRVEFLLSYTWSKALTDQIGYYGSGGVNRQGTYWANTYDRKSEWGPAFFDARNNFLWSGSYDLPFGKGRKWGADLHPVANGILGGWTVSSIVNLRSGFPVTVTTTVDRSQQAVRGGQRPNRIGSGEVSNPTLDKWIDISAFTQAALGTFGDAGVGILRAPGFANWDFSVGKKFALTEARYVEFRTEFFNFTNHPSFSPPARDFAAPNTFGTITSTISEPRIMEFALKLYF